MEDKNQETIKELQEMKKQAEEKPESVINDRLIKAINKKIELLEKENVEK